ncbi:MAG TPA: hypothetical protein VKZ44_08625, partial [Taishania sp.]|nr:hypothetical protein [Taishania sp.]
QPANANEKQAIETELASIESRLSELKQTEITLNETKNNATNLAQNTNQNATEQPKSVEAIQQELARSYNGNLTNDLTQTPADLAETKAIQNRLEDYRKQLQSKQPANANEKQAIETELASIESRLSELKQTEIAFNETKNNATELAQNNNQTDDKKVLLEQQLADEKISTKERQALNKELHQIYQEEAKQKTVELTVENRRLSEEIQAIQQIEHPKVKTVIDYHQSNIQSLESTLKSTKDPIQQVVLQEQLIQEKTNIINLVNHENRIQYDQAVVDKNPAIKLHDQTTLQARRKQALIEIEELTHLYNEKTVALHQSKKKDQPAIQHELTAIEAKKELVRQELRWIDQQIEQIKPIDEPLPLKGNPVKITYNEERAIASSENYEKYANLIAQQNELISELKAIEKQLDKTREQLEHWKTENSQALSQTQIAIRQSTDILSEIEKSSLSLESLEKKIAEIHEKAQAVLPNDPHEAMKFQNLVARGINPIKKALIATTLVPLSANGIEFITNKTEVKAIPVGIEAPKGLVYRVQVGAFAKPIPVNHFNEFTPVSGEKLENSKITRYMAGYFNTAAAVVEAREKIRQLGYHDAFVVAYCDGKRIQFGEARKMEETGACSAKPMEEIQEAIAQQYIQKLGLEDTSKTLKRVPEYTYNRSNGAAKATAIEQLDENMVYFTVQIGVYNKPVSIDKLHNLSPLYTYRLENGQIRYSVGIFGDIPSARELETSIRKKGISDAFITAYYQGNRITIERAKKLIEEGVRSYSPTSPVPVVKKDEAPVEQVKEVAVFNSSNTQSATIRKNENFVQFISKETFEEFPREALNRYNAKGIFHYDKVDKKIKSIYYPQATILPRIASFSNQMDTLVLTKQQRMEANKDFVLVQLKLDAIPGDFNDWLIKYPYRKEYSFSENGLEIRIFGVRNEDLIELRNTTNLFGFELVENELEIESNDK